MNNLQNYTDAIGQIKSAILQSRYKAAASANKELLSLYYGIGQYISKHSRTEFWGTSALKNISNALQQELPGLRGFSESNLKNMRMFYEEWNIPFQQNTPLKNNKATVVRQMPSGELQSAKSFAANISQININQFDVIRQLPTGEFMTTLFLPLFLRVGFSHHYEILSKTTTLEERIFYIEKTATEFWSVETLRHHLKNNLYAQRSTLPNNFEKTITQSDLRAKALLSFKEEYLLDFINIEDPDEADEREIENEIVRNIRKFIMALGSDFSFVGNQYRLTIAEEQFFIDLLFFNRRLQSLVAIELKKGKFKPEYLGKMNMYLSALDTYIKQPYENPSIGIILCKEKNDTIVEFAFRDFTKPMGVATYKTASEVPEQYRNILPNAATFKELLS
jgi:predicted nuclease of restriction endonuclease-like (RecB) superfamily